ncbi:MAG: RNA 2',3'-cyclic phosphodiesterase [Nitrospirota bacterium]
MMEIRTFIAINMTTEIKESPSKIQTELKKQACLIAETDVKWVEPQGMHLTLKFLGNILIGQLESICQMVLEATSNFNQFQLSLSSLGAFPNLSGTRQASPKVVWVGVDKGKEECIQLAKRIDNDLRGLPRYRLGFPVESKEFFPHLTLGRVKNPRGGLPRSRNELSKLIAEARLTELKTKSFGQMFVSKVEVMGSQLTPKGSIYTTLRELELMK